ncbi:MAG: S-adenosylmethionine decarboxylase family protein, partial [Bacillaceae bacterium]
MKLDTLGRHILVEYYNCNEDILRDPLLIEKYMCEAAIEAQATIVESCFHHFNPWGV